MFKDIKGFEGLYAACEDGSIWAYPKISRKEGRFLKPSKTNCGYMQVVLFKEGKLHKFYVHRLIAQHFCKIPKLYKDRCTQVNHKDGVKTNNQASNLEWVSPSENRKHAFRIGIQKITEKQRLASRNNIMQYNLTKGVKNVQHNSV